MKSNIFCKFANEFETVRPKMTDRMAEDRILRLSRILREAREVVVAAHTHPDGDALGSVTAAVSYLLSAGCPRVSAILPDAPPDNLRFICEDIPLLSYDREPEEAARRIVSCDLILLLDCNGISRTEGLAPLLRASHARKVLIDHHLNPETEAFDLVFSDASMSSASELLYHLLKALPEVGGNASRLPRTTVRALLTGMTTDTNNFANSTSPSTLRMAADLLEAGADRSAILSQLYNQYRENRVRVRGFLQSQVMKITPEGAAYIIATREMLERFDVQEGETEGLVNVPLTIARVRISLFLKEDKGHFRVSIRSKTGTSAQKMAATYFHGGGHENAAGGKLYFPGDIDRREDAGTCLEKLIQEFLS